jgi:hypothetical protein
MAEKAAKKPSPCWLLSHIGSYACWRCDQKRVPISEYSLVQLCPLGRIVKFAAIAVRAAIRGDEQWIEKSADDFIEAEMEPIDYEQLLDD